MQYRVSEKLKFPISAVGLGCSAAWSKPWFAEAKAVSLVHKALDCGINYFDTGPSYEAGNAERRLSLALAEKDCDRILISTKVGMVVRNGSLIHDFSKQSVIESIHASLRRLRLDVLPLVWLHGPDLADLSDELFDTLFSLRSEGKLSLVGINSFNTQVLKRAVEMHHVDAIMPDFNNTMLDRLNLIDKMAKRGGLTIAGSPLGNLLGAPSFLLPKSRADVWYALRALRHHPKRLLRGALVSKLSNSASTIAAESSLRFVLNQPNVLTAVFGTTRAEHLMTNAAIASSTNSA